MGSHILLKDAYRPGRCWTLRCSNPQPFGWEYPQSLPSEPRRERCACLLHYTGNCNSVNLDKIRFEKQSQGANKEPGNDSNSTLGAKLTNSTETRDMNKRASAVGRLPGTGSTIKRNTPPPSRE